MRWLCLSLVVLPCYSLVILLLFSCYSGSVKVLDYWLTTDSVGELYEYLDSKSIGYEFA